jgi:hypothetical protein
MRALEQPYAPPDARLLTGTPVPALAILVVAWVAAVVTLPASVARGAGLAVAHGALLGTAVAWTTSRGRWAPLEAAALLAGAAASATLAPWGALTYLAVPAWLLWRCRPMHAGLDAHGKAVLAGGLFGLLLGLHLLVNGSLTLGHRLRPGRPEELLAWLAYDVGANVLAAEAFFRAGLFTRAHRQWSFAAAALLSASASVVRYLVDPLLPRSAAMLAGAIFYLALLGVGNCWLLARSGSLAGPIAAGLVFFAAYRLLAR